MLPFIAAVQLSLLDSGKHSLTDTSSGGTQVRGK